MIFSRTIFRFLLFAISGLFIQNNINAQETNFSIPQKHEVRAVWLTTVGGLDWPRRYANDTESINRQKAELTTMLDKLHHAGINTVLFQTRIRGTVIYPSEIEPWDGCCSGVPGRSPWYDPLAFAISECHRRGMEIQAWVVTIPLGKWNGLGCKTLRNKHPKLVVKKGADGYIDPANPLAADYIASICREITNNYDIDGIHLDYIRYPETWSVSTNMKETARRNITTIVKRVHDKVKSVKPWVKLSCSPIGKYNDLNRYSSNGWNAWGKGCQPAQQWLKDGLMDQLFPMIYFRGNNFYPFLMDWIENADAQRIVPGLGVYFLSSNEGNWAKEEIVRQMNVSHSLGTGYAFFRAKFLCDNVKDIYQFTANHLATYPTLTHPISGNKTNELDSPTNLTVKHGDGFDVLSWNFPEHKYEEKVTFNVYSSTKYPVDTNDPRNLVSIRNNQCEITINTPIHRYYAVTAVNRYGEESHAMECEKLVRQNNYIDNDGQSVNLNNFAHFIGADVIVIESLRGNIVSTIPVKGNSIDISKLKKGAYVIKSLNSRNVRHVIGRFVKQ